MMDLDQHLTAEIYRDALTPEMSVEPALHGVDIIQSVAPWVRILGQDRTAFDGMSPEPLDVENTQWPSSEADVVLILTKRPLLNVVDSAAKSNRSDNERHIGATLTWIEPRLERVVVVDVSSIRRPEHIVAHELGHVLDVKGQDSPAGSHCQRRDCIMYPSQFVYGKADRSFCECCSQQIHDNSLLLRKSRVTKSGLSKSKF